MKRKLIFTGLTILLAACSNNEPIKIQNKTLEIKSGLLDHEKYKWELQVDWFKEKRGGAVMLKNGYQHSLNDKNDLELFLSQKKAGIKYREITEYSETLSKLETEHKKNKPYKNEFNRDSNKKIIVAWRKYCKNSIDLSDIDKIIIKNSEMPNHLNGKCESGNVFK